MARRESIYFLQGFCKGIDSVGSIWPTSSVAIEAIISEFVRRSGPRRVLEVGPGTGAITSEIVRHMGANDELVICEINADFVAYLQQRFEQEPHIRERRTQITLLQMDVTQIDRNERFDFIISTIPFTNCRPDVVEAIFECYQTILKPTGVLSFIEYAYLRSLKQYFMPAARQQMAMVDRVVARMVKGHIFRRDFELRNMPPVWVQHLRFHSPEPDEALALAPLTHNQRIALGPTAGLATDAIGFFVTLLGISILWRGWARIFALFGAAGVAAFFRDPIRSVHLDPTVAYAAADGRVLAVERMYDTRFGDIEWLRIAVFLNITDVHMNRSPIAGKVVRVLTQKGDFAIASNPAADHNHTVYTVIEGHKSRCVVAQRVGMVARRIVNWTHPGELLAQGERYGLMRFGSRIDVYLPANLVEPCVSVGEKVVGAITVLARYR